MPTRVQFADKEYLVVEEDFQTVNEALRQGSALVHRQGSKARAAVFASNIRFIEEYEASEPQFAAV